MSEQLVLLSIIIAAMSGFPGLFVSRTLNIGQWSSVLLSAIAAACGLLGTSIFWINGEITPIIHAWSIPGGEFHVAMDGLSALFLMPIFLISLLGNIYGLSYWKQSEHPSNGRKLRLFYGLLTAGMALLVIARNSMLFMIGWELMAISAFFLVTTEDDVAEIRRTGWIYLVATKLATISLIALFSLLHAAGGDFSFKPFSDDALSPGISTGIFCLTIIGFGLKTGVMPFHVWLPSAHANAPSHVSAIMSGVIIKMGIYGIVRVTSLVPHPPIWWGTFVMSLGAISGVLGIAYAVGQRDLKRLLAYSSIENVGIIFMGIGLALIGRSVHRGDLIILGMSGALLHVWNHALFKSLLFFNAGSIIHAVETRNIDQLGGLAKKMPYTTVLFVIGAMSVCGFPPLNGFVSEFLIYLGMFSTLQEGTGVSIDDAALAAPILAMIGALAVACFVKVFGIVFLGTARTEHSRVSHESDVLMIAPMCVLAACCFTIGLSPKLIAPVITKALIAWSPELNDVDIGFMELAPLDWVGGMARVLVCGVALVSLLLTIRLRTSTVEYGTTWGCGFAAPTSRMQYTSSSFAETLVKLFNWALRTRIRTPKELVLFPKPTHFHSEMIDPVLDEAVLPLMKFFADQFSRCRVFQQGNIQAYLLYVFMALVALLLI